MLAWLRSAAVSAIRPPCSHSLSIVTVTKIAIAKAKKSSVKKQSNSECLAILAWR
jgi:hypothetical protein